MVGSLGFEQCTCRARRIPFACARVECGPSKHAASTILTPRPPRCPSYICSALIGIVLQTGGLIHPRSTISHATKCTSEASCAGSFGDGGLAASLISSVSDGLHAVWRASDGELPVIGKGVVECTGRAGSSLPPPVVSTAADQFLLLTDDGKLWFTFAVLTVHCCFEVRCSTVARPNNQSSPMA